MAGITAFLDDIRAQVDVCLDHTVPPADVPPTRLHEAVRWSIFAGGKRVRPALVFAAGRTFGAADEKLLATAAAIELIHTYSLVHDDLPAMDDDDLRRGRPTCHKQFGEATAILAGDVMQTMAFGLIAADDTLSGELRLRLISMISAAAGTPSGMVSGQQLDLSAEGASITAPELENIHRQKTGALIIAAALAGAMIGEAADHELASIEGYAGALGLLFQVVDDHLDVTQSTQTLGKTAGKDAAAKKATYPSVMGIDATRQLAGELRSTAITSLDNIDHDTSLLRELVNLVENRTN